jgi:hypothetical protein
MSKFSKLQILSVNNFKQNFGSTEYAVFNCSTDKNDGLTVAVSYPALEASGISISLLDDIIGSTIIATDNTDLVTGAVTSGADRVQGIIDGTILNDNPKSPNFGNPIKVLLLNRTNCSIVKSASLISEIKQLDSLTQSKVVIEKAKEKALVTARRNQERMQAKLLGLTPDKPADEKAPVAPVLETNTEDIPF